jgi:hypothetical protein
MLPMQLQTKVLELTSLAIIDSAIGPTILHVQNPLIVFEDVEISKLIVGSADKSEVWLRLRIRLNIPRKHVAISKRNCIEPRYVSECFGFLYEDGYTYRSVCSPPMGSSRDKPLRHPEEGPEGDLPLGEHSYTNLHHSFDRLNYWLHSPGIFLRILDFLNSLLWKVSAQSQRSSLEKPAALRVRILPGDIALGRASCNHIHIRTRCR